MKIYVLVPHGNIDYAKKVQDAGAIPVFSTAGDVVEGKPVVQGPSKARPGVIVQGGLDRAGLVACQQKGAAGILLDASLWLLPESPLGDADKNAMRMLNAQSFGAGDVTLPSGLKVGRDALLAPFVIKRASSLRAALDVIRMDLGSAPASPPPVAAPPATPPPTPVVAPAPPPPPPPPPAATPAPPKAQATSALNAPPSASGSSRPAVAAAPPGADVLAKVIELVAQKTGYPPDLLDPTLDMEADLGIDTVKQAEIFGQLRETFRVERDEKLTLKDIPTLGKVAEYLSSRMAGGATPSPASAPTLPAAQPARATPTPVPVAQPAPQAPPAVTAAPPAPSAPTSAQRFETQPPQEAVAIIGVGAVLPKANDAKAFWNNVLAKVDSIIEVPRDRWDPAVHYDADASKEDRTYAKIGGFITDFTFDPLKFRIPPQTAKALDPVQQMALTAAAEALADAGYDKKAFDRARCAVILGNSLGGERKDETSSRMHVDAFAASLKGKFAPDQIEAAVASYKRTLPVITEDSMPGELSNVIAGRLANVLNLGGKNLTTDAACASSHAALDTAVKAILGGEADMVLCGGADRSMDPATYVKFCKIGALSPTGSRPFDAGADGFVMGEGVAILLLKRLSDAVRDGDKIYCVIRGMGSSSDGKGKGITAPNPVGQKLAVERALKVSEIAPKHVQLVEAHGTSTKVGDVVEVESIAELYKGVAPGTVALGSVKSQIGHLKSAAGAAGMLKAAFALKEKVLPPSINFRTPNPNIKWSEVPFYVNTDQKPWPPTPNGEPRRAAVSAFGFGGTNFHVVLEEYVPAYHNQPRAAPQPAAMSRPAPSAAPLIEGELVVLGADSIDGLVAEASAAAARVSQHATLANAAAAVRTPRYQTRSQRVAIGAMDRASLQKALTDIVPLLPDPKGRAALPLKVKGSQFGEGPKAAGKIAFLFPGQGSQYANMCHDLAKRYPVVRRTFEEADVVLEPLIGRKLTSLIFVDATDKAAVARAEEALRQTEVTQPAMLAADVAIYRLLLEHGVKPDMVGGHSLGEYAALVAAGVLSFQDALIAVSARGKEMANVHVPDKGLMASVSAGPDQVEAVLRNVQGYVVAANKNCPVQTVIAGETPAVQRAVEVAKQMGVETMLLNVSAAFHTKIVAPASEPLRRVLERLSFRAPQIVCYTNVDATPYPNDPAAQRDILSKQVAAPVEWIAELDAMYAAGARIFIEVGPKRALAGFVDQTLGKREGVVSVVTNHPKAGDLRSIYDALGKLAVIGHELTFPAPANEPQGVQGQAQGQAQAQRFAGQGQGQGQAQGIVAHPTLTPDALGDWEAFRKAIFPSLEASLQQSFAQFRAELRKAQEMSAAFEKYGLVPCDVVVGGASVGLPGQARRLFDDNNFESLFRGENRIDRLDAKWADKFIEKEITRLVKDAGEPRMEKVTSAADVLKLAGRKGDLDVVKDYGVDEKLTKTLDITSKMAIAAALEALHDAGIPLVRETIVTKSGKMLPGGWVLPAFMQDDTGVVFASAFPGYDNFVQEISRHVARKYARATLDELDALYHELLDVVPADRKSSVSRFYAKHAHKLHELAGDEEKLAGFNRHFLFAVLSLGHAELAEFIHARGPNTQINAACSSSTQAVAIAEDWLRTGRCKRVIVVGADDVTSENMLEWIGSGFLASGAATTAPSVEEGALPFDRRRHGMIIGSGAVGLILERKEDVDARGMVPVARLLATRVANSAYHGSRLHVEHIANEARALVETAARRAGTTPEAMGPKTIFVSHETYTPARGGSASAEAAAMRHAFGSGATQVLVTNTKGFTGHAMGAGLEDALAVKALQFNRVPPIANLREIDPDFVDLTLSKGGAHDRRYAMRFSAGFGSQLALAVFEKMADGANRTADAARYQAFLDRCAAMSGAKAERVGRVLRIVNGQTAAAMHTASLVKVPEFVRAPEPAATPVPLTAESRGIAGDARSPSSAPRENPAAPRAPAVGAAEVLDKVIELVAEKTGYPREMLDPTLDMEADLGIDTVKQAEIFSQLRESFSIARDDKLTLKDIPTLGKVAEYLSSRMSGFASSTPANAPLPAAPAPAPAPAPATELVRTTPVAEPARVAPHAPATGGDSDEILRKVTAMIASKTGYPAEMLDPTLDMEADLGIDTVKQAEIFGEVREAFSIPKLEGINLKDYPTIRHVAGFVATNAGRSAPAAAASVSVPVVDLPKSSALVRRVPRVVDSPAEGSTSRRAFVAGHGMLAEAVRHHFPAASGDVAVFEGSARELFTFAKSRSAELESGKLGILAVTHLGGTHGIDRAANPEHGGVTGAAKSLAQEFPNAWIRALDLDPNEDIAARLRAIEAELRVDRSLVEVGRARGRRIVIETIEAGPTSAQTPTLRPNSVLLVTGGARGITAAILKQLAAQRPTLILVGRTAAPTATDAAFDEAATKQRAMTELAARGERVTPVNIEKFVAPFRARHEIWNSLQELRAAGANAHYASIDVGDPAALAQAVAFARTHGRITGVIHAAGVEESKRLVDKDEAAFDRAWKPKAQAALELAKMVEADKPDFFVMFGSVAGRYGNAAQFDYSAANDCMAKLARVLRQKGIPASVFAWGPWGEVGMALKGSTLTVLKAAGVEAITTTEGVQAFMSELTRLDEPEVVLAKSLGTMAAKTASPPTTGVGRGSLTLTASEPALNDHRVDGVPFMPGVMGLQAFADAAGSNVAGFEDVHWAYPVKLLRDQPVEATIKLESDKVSLTTVPPGPLKQERTHFTARVLRSPTPQPSPSPSAAGASWVHDRIYPPFFHGPAFRVLSRATHFGWDSIEVEGRQPTPGITPMMATLEGALQALGLWGLAIARTMALPERVRRVHLFGNYEPGATHYRVTNAKLANDRVTGDVQCIAHGRVVASLEGVSLISTGPMSIADAPAPWHAEDVDIAGTRLVKVRVEEARTLLARPELWPAYLGAAELAALHGLTVEKRREEWLAATLAGKTALRRAARDARAWNEIEVLRGSDGAPVNHGAWGLTLSHAGGVAIALAFDATRERCGVDVESIEYRAPSFETEAFSEEERRELPTGPAREPAVTTAWAAKEATLKALGVGLSIPLSSLRVKTNGKVEVEMSGAAKEKFLALDGSSLDVDARREGSLAFALARIRLAKRG